MKQKQLHEAEIASGIKILKDWRELMNILGFGISGGEYYTGYAKKKERASDMAFSDPLERSEEEKVREQDVLSEKEDEAEESGGSQTQIVVKPDGSRVLMVTTRVCGMETTTSLKISDQTSLLHTASMSDVSGINNSAASNGASSEMCSSAAGD